MAPAATEEGGAAGRKSRLDLVRPTLAIGVAGTRVRQVVQLAVPLMRERLAPVAEASDLPGEAHVLLAQIADLRPHLLPPLEQALGLALNLLHGLAQVGEPVLRLLDGRRLERVPGAEAGDARALALLGLLQLRHLPGQRLVLRGERGPVGGEQRQVEDLLFLVQRLVLAGLPRLALDGPELAPHFLHHVPDARQVLARGLELALRLRALLLVARDPRGLLDEDAPLPRLCREHVVEALLVHEGIRLGVDAGSGEEVLDVAQTAHVAVQQVLALARPIEPAGHRHLAPRDLELPVIVEDEAHLGHPDRLARGRAVEDHVLHLVAPQGLGALLPERPADGVGDIGLAAPVGADDAGHPGEDLHFGLVGEGLEAVDEYRREPHSSGRPRRPLAIDNTATARLPRKKPHG